MCAHMHTQHVPTHVYRSILQVCAVTVVKSSRRGVHHSSLRRAQKHITSRDVDAWIRTVRRKIVDIYVILSGSIIENSIQESVDHVYCHVGRLVTKFGMI